MPRTRTSIGAWVSWAFPLAFGLVWFGCAEANCPSGQTVEGGFCTGPDPMFSFSLVETVPADGATDVASDTNVTARFDSDVDLETLDAMTFSVATAHGSIPGQIALGETPDTAVFNAEVGLALLCEHTATLTTDVRSVDGIPLASETTWAFGTSDGAWTAPDSIELEGEGVSVESLDVAFDDAGNAVAVWEQRLGDPSVGSIWASRFTPSGGWGAPEQVSDGAPDATTPDLAVDGAGNALVVWVKNDGVASIWANRFASGRWFGAEQIDGFASAATEPRVDMGPNNVGVAVWRQEAGDGSGRIFANSFTTPNGWASRKAVDDAFGEASAPDVAMAGDGTATAVWQQMGGNQLDIWSSQCVPGCADWSAAVLLETDDAGAAEAPRIAGSPTGSAIVVWQQSDGPGSAPDTRTGVWSNVFDPEMGWGGPEAIRIDDSGDAENPHIAANPDGKGVAVWTLGGETKATEASQYAASVGWGDIVVIEDQAGISVSPQVAIDPNGNAVAVGQRVEGTVSQAWRNRLAADGTWGSAERIEGFAAFGSRVAVDRLGYSLFLWSVGDGVEWSRLE